MALNPPIFNSAVYNGANVLAFWTPAQNSGFTVTGFLITVAGSDGSKLQTTINNPLAGAGSVATGKLNTSVTYTVQVCVMATGQPNACTEQYLLVTTQPSLQTVDYNGAEVHFSWTPVPSAAGQIGSYVVAIFPTGGGVTTAVTIHNPQASSAVIPLTTPLNGAYSAQVTAQTTYSVGSATPPTPFNTTLPAILSATYNGSAILLAWNAPPSPAVPLTGYLLTAFSPDGGAPFTQTISSGVVQNGSIPIPYPLDPVRQYFVTVSATTASPARSSSAPLEINSQQPELLSVEYNGSQLAATWRPVGYPSTPVSSYVLSAFSPSGGSPITATIAQPWASSGLINQPAFVAGLSYQFQAGVQAENGSLTTSDALPIFTAVPLVTSALYNGESVVVSWNALESGPTVEQYRVTIVSSLGSYSISVSGMQQQAEIMVGHLSESVSWSVSLVAVAGRAAASSALYTLLADQPLLTSVGYNGSTVLVSWNPPAQAGIAVTSFTIQVSGDPGYPEFTSPPILPPVSSGTLQLPNPLNPAGRYVLQVIAATANGMNSSSVAVALIVQLPVVRLIDFDNGQAAVEWAPVPSFAPSISGYELKAYSDQGGQPSIVTYNNALLTRGVVPVTPGNLSWKINVCALAGVVNGCAASPVDLVQNAPAIQKVSYDAGTLNARWEAITGASMYVLQLQQSSFTIAEQLFGTTQGALPVEIDPSQTYTVRVRAGASSQTAQSLGPWTAWDLIVTAPVLSSVSYLPGTLTVNWTYTPGSSVTGYMVFLYQGFSQVASQAVSGSEEKQSILTQTLSLGSYTIRVQATGTGVSGPLSAPVPVIVTAPVVEMASYDGTNMSVRWTEAPEMAVTGYQVTIVRTDTKAVVATQNTNLNWAVIPFTPVQNISYTVQAQGTGVLTAGPAGAATPLLTEPLSIAAVSYNANAVSVTANGSAPAYVFSLVLGGAIIRRQFSNTATIQLEAVLDGSSGYSVMVQPANAVPPASALGTPVVTGPSASADVLTAVPIVTSVTYVPGTLTVQWQPLTNSLITGYMAFIFQAGVQVAAQSVSGAGAGQAQISSSLNPALNYTVNVRTTGTGCSGPFSISAPAIVAAPVIQNASYDGQNLSVQWSRVGQEGVAGYVIVLTPANGNAVTFHTTAETSLTAPLLMDLGTTWNATVQAFGLNATGPVSSPGAVALPAIVAPTITELTYDGSHLNISWTRGSLPYLNGYTVSLSTGATYQTGPETELAVPLDATTANGVHVSITGNSASRSTTASAGVSVVGISPVIDSVAVASSNVTVQWSVSNPPSNAGYIGELLDGETVIATAAGTATGVSFPAPSGGGNFSVRGRILSVPAAGPLGAAVAVFTLPPSIQFSALAKDTLNISWMPPANGGIAAYRVTCGGQEFSTSETSLNVPVKMSGLVGQSITVAAIAPNSSGPAATQQVVSAYSVSSGYYDGATLQVTLGAAPNSAPAQVWVEVFLEGVVTASAVVMGVPSSSIPIAVALPRGAAVQVGAIGVGSSAITPPGTAIAIPTSLPGAASAIYDGAKLHVSLGPVPDPGITGYQITVAGATSPINPVYVEGVTSATINAQFALPFTANAQVTVQAAVNLGGSNLLVGPGTVIVPKLAGYLRAIAIPGSAQPPYIYRKGNYQTLADVSASNITEYLPNPFSQGTPTIPPGSGNIFQLAPSPAGSLQPYQLTIEKSVWTTFSNAPVRSALRDSYRQFLVTVEQAGVAPWAIRLVRQIIAEAMPQTFAETLYYRYGVWRDQSARLLDLEPGLRLRISGALYQLITSKATDLLNGFISAGSENFDVAEAVPSGGGGTLPAGPARVLTVDSFLSLLYPGASSTATEIAAGAIDFFRAANRQYYYRLFYPPVISSSNSTGSTDPTQNIALIGAPSWQVLEYVTDQYSLNGFFPPSGNYYTAYFRGHATLSPVLKLTLAEEECWTAPGTTIRQLLCAVGLGVWQGPGGADAISLNRPVSSLYDESFSLQTLRYEPVNLSEAPIANQDPPLWTLDLPVCSGDVIAIETGD